MLIEHRTSPVDGCAFRTEVVKQKTPSSPSFLFLFFLPLPLLPAPAGFRISSFWAVR